MSRRAFALFVLAFAGAAQAQAPLSPNPTAIERGLSAPVRAQLSAAKAGAAAGDYQAMRNYAFTWSTDAARENPDASIVGCAWYALILRKHAARAHDGDRSNKALYCGRLTAAQAQRAGALLADLSAKPAK